MNRDDLSKEFNLQTFKQLVTGLVETELYSESKNIQHSSSLIKKADNIGHFLDNRFNNVLVITHDATVSVRVKLATDTFKLMAENNIDKALVAYVSTTGEQEWRLSYISISIDEIKGKIKKIFSNPRRYSYVLGPRAKTATPFNYLIAKGAVSTLEELQERFSLEVVNNAFYKEIARLYDRLVGAKNIQKELKYPGSNEDCQEFAVRLIGRIIFCWFLREKRSIKGIPLIPNAVLSLEASRKPEYFKSVLEPLFFEVLNKEMDARLSKFKQAPYDLIPYLNGGLFSDDIIDYYGDDSSPKTITDKWLLDLFDLLERYNFTVDENTSIDTELSIDPEMLGRVFENLLARINPETGETVRKSTGSFYTPREIVDYMVSNSLIEFLSAMTIVPESKLSALVSYDLEDDIGNKLNEEEVELVLGALSELTVIDPACGSGAFPIGMLQKILHIISILDPDAKWWLNKQLQSITSLELKREFDNKSANYIRKLGIINKSIFGVDIQPIATEISRLRCFLTLIVDEEIDDNAKNRGIRPLPNLDFKIMQGNSLIEKYGKIKLFDDELIYGDHNFDVEATSNLVLRQADLQREYLSLHSTNMLTPIKQNQLQSQLKSINKQLIQLKGRQNVPNNNQGLFDKFSKSEKTRTLLIQLHKDYFACTDKIVKRKIQSKINDTEWELIEETLKENNQHQEIDRLSKFKMSKVKPFFIWQLNFPDVFENGGFDIVIANPPYISINALSKTNDTFAKYLKSSDESVGNYCGVNLHSTPISRKTYPPKPNLYAFFFARATRLAKPKGCISFIVPQNLLTAKDLDVVRYLVSETQTLNRLLVVDDMVFKGDTATSTVPTSSLVLFVINEKNSEYTALFTKSKLDHLNKINYQPVNKEELIKSINNWSIHTLGGPQKSILSKYMSAEIADIYYNHAKSVNYFGSSFYFDVGFTLNNSKILKSVDDENKYYKLFNSKGMKDVILLTEDFYPKDKAAIQLTKNSQGYVVLEQEFKIVWSVKNPKCFSFTDEDIVFPMGRAAIIASKNKKEVIYLWLLLNSAINKYMFELLLKSPGEKDYLLPISSVKTFFRIPKISPERGKIKNELINIGERIIGNSTDDAGELWDKIDILAGKLYDLTDKELQLIEASTK